MGRSRAQGDIEFRWGEVIAIEGAVHAPLLELNPWLVDDQEEAAEPATEPGRKRYVFDETPLPRLSEMGLSVDVRLSADEAELGFSRYTDIDSRVVLAGHRAEISPFRLSGPQSGRYDGHLLYDSSAAMPALSVDLEGKDMRLGLGAREGQDPATLPQGDIYLDVAGQGWTRREMAASLDGVRSTFIARVRRSSRS